MNKNIQNLSDEQLDGIVGGAALPAAFDKYVNSKGGIKIGHSIVSSRPGEYSGTKSYLSMKADTEEVASYLDELESKGVTQVSLYCADGKDVDLFSIGQVRAMLG